MDRKYLEVCNTFEGYSYDEWNKCEFFNVVFYTLKSAKTSKIWNFQNSKNQAHFRISHKIQNFKTIISHSRSGTEISGPSIRSWNSIFRSWSIVSDHLVCGPFFLQNTDRFWIYLDSLRDFSTHASAYAKPIRPRSSTNLYRW